MGDAVNTKASAGVFPHAANPARSWGNRRAHFGLLTGSDRGRVNEGETPAFGAGFWGRRRQLGSTKRTFDAVKCQEIFNLSPVDAAWYAATILGDGVRSHSGALGPLGIEIEECNAVRDPGLVTGIER